jgi:hypothetical protein
VVLQHALASQREVVARAPPITISGLCTGSSFGAPSGEKYLSVAIATHVSQSSRPKMYKSVRPATEPPARAFPRPGRLIREALLPRPLIHARGAGAAGPPLRPAATCPRTDLIHLSADRQLHAERPREVVGAARRRHTFGDMPERGQHLRERSAPTELEAYRAIARHLAGAGQDQVPEAGEPGGSTGAPPFATPAARSPKGRA